MELTRLSADENGRAWEERKKARRCERLLNERMDAR